jgi:hypothetical protein
MEAPISLAVVITILMGESLVVISVIIPPLLETLLSIKS